MSGLIDSPIMEMAKRPCLVPTQTAFDYGLKLNFNVRIMLEPSFDHTDAKEQPFASGECPPTIICLPDIAADLPGFLTSMPYGVDRILLAQLVTALVELRNSFSLLGNALSLETNMHHDVSHAFIELNAHHFTGTRAIHPNIATYNISTTENLCWLGDERTRALRLLAMVATSWRGDKTSRWRRCGSIELASLDLGSTIGDRGSLHCHICIRLLAIHPQIRHAVTKSKVRTKNTYLQCSEKTQ